jgi:hypothetical protein
LQQDSRNQRYTYSYSKLGDSPRDLLHSGRPAENGGAVVFGGGSGGGTQDFLQPGDTFSVRSDWSRSSSPPPPEDIIQVQTGKPTADMRAHHRVLTRPPPLSPWRQVEIIWTSKLPPLLPTEIGEWYSRTISIKGQAAHRYCIGKKSHPQRS